MIGEQFAGVKWSISMKPRVAYNMHIISHSNKHKQTRTNMYKYQI